MRRTTLALCAVGLLAAGAVGGLALAQAPAAFQRFTPENLKWVPYPGDGGTLGVQEAVEYGDPGKSGLYVVRIRFPPHVMSRPHSHPEDRFIVVLKGVWWTGTGDRWDPKATVAMRPGDAMLHPAKAVHFDGGRDEGAEIQIVGVGPSRLDNASPGTPDFAKF